MKIIVTGASDDCIELDGDVSEEFYAIDGEDDYLAFSDGTLLRIWYDGIWAIFLDTAGTASFKHQAGNLNADRSDVAFLEGDIRWVVHGTDVCKFASR